MKIRRGGVTWRGEIIGILMTIMKIIKIMKITGLMTAMEEEKEV